MSAYALATFRNLDMNEEISDYTRRIDATLTPFGGRFLIHGGPKHEKEGNWHGEVTVLLEFPEIDRAQAWYASPAYAEILPLRTRNSEGEVVLIEGVPEGYSADTVARRIRGA